jgi:hypothetical protein
MFLDVHGLLAYVPFLAGIVAAAAVLAPAPARSLALPCLARLCSSDAGRVALAVRRRQWWSAAGQIAASLSNQPYTLAVTQYLHGHFITCATGQGW